MYHSPDWENNPPEFVGQPRRHNGRDYLSAVACEKCGDPFWPRRGQSVYCDDCKKCPFCDRPMSNPRGMACIKCQRSKALTDKQLVQLKQIHKGMVGDGNPAKRPEVRAKISKGLKALGDNHPSRLDIERAAAHMNRIRPVKTSKLEDTVAGWLPEFERQYKVRWYALDFALPDEKLAIEVQGCWHHSCPICFPGSPIHKVQKKCRWNDKKKQTYLRNRGWTVMYIWGHTIRAATDPMSLSQIKQVGEVYVPNN